MSMMSDGDRGGGGESSKPYDYLLKFLLVGDSDVGKHEILHGLDDGSSESPFCVGSGRKNKIIILMEIKCYHHPGQNGTRGRVIQYTRDHYRSISGIFFNFEEKKIFQKLIDMATKTKKHHFCTTLPRVMILKTAFRIKVSQNQAEQYGTKNQMSLFEVSPLCDFNIVESFTELSRLALKRNGMERLWRANKVLTLQELCSRTIVASTTVYGIEHLPLPPPIKSHLKSYTIQSHATRLRQGSSSSSQSSIRCRLPTDEDAYGSC
ncbi:unnamed protein product, partial [Meganyctiphanes norvegica]